MRATQNKPTKLVYGAAGYMVLSPAGPSDTSEISPYLRKSVPGRQTTQLRPAAHAGSDLLDPPIGFDKRLIGLTGDQVVSDKHHCQEDHLKALVRFSELLLSCLNIGLGLLRFDSRD